MNYYEHHIGDYAEATAHLSLLEDAIYSRLLRKYYATERPIPADTKRVQRWVGARLPEEIEALHIVLEEFFVLEEDGYHNARCDREIAAFNAGQPERDLKKANEANRLKRHRDDRAELFKALTDAGGHADWNIKMADLRELVRQVTVGRMPLQPVPDKSSGEGKPATPPATAPATPATATHSPIPIPHTPVCVPRGRAGEQPGPVGPTRTGFESEQPDSDAGSGADARPGGAQLVAVVVEAMRSAGLPDVSATHPKLQALLSSGLSSAELASAALYAAKKGQGFAYALATAEGRRRDAAAVGALPAAPVVAVVDPDSRAGIEATARALGLRGWDQAAEQWPQFAARVRRARVGVAA